MFNHTTSKLYQSRNLCLIIVLFQSFSISAQTYNNVDSFVEHIIERQGIPGVALAIIKDGNVIHKKNYGYANLEHQVPVKQESIFRLYSLTKPIVAVAAFQLIEQNKISLNDMVSTYINDLPQSWQNRQIKHLLTHSSGFPDMWSLQNRQEMTELEAKTNVFKNDLKFKAGSQYDYNQTNFWLLQKIIEKASKTTLSDFIIQNQFKGNPGSVFFSSDSRDIVMNRSTPYFYFNKGKLILDHSYMQGDYGNAMNGLNVRLEDFIEWDSKFSQGLFLKKETQQKMFETFEYTDSEKVFAYSWDKFNTNGNESYGFSGSLVTEYRIYPDKNLSIVLLSNGLSAWYNIDNIVNYIAGLVDPSLAEASNTVFELLLQSSLEKDFGEFKQTYLNLKKHNTFKNINFEEQINYVGYMLLNLKKIDKTIEVFQLNVEAFPNSWNVYDSLAEAFEKNQDNKQALINYRKALKLNTSNQFKRNSLIEDKINKLEQLLD